MSTDFYIVPPIDLEISILGDLISKVFDDSLIEIETSIHGTLVISKVIVVSPIEITISLTLLGISVSTEKSNWVKWSKVGVLDFVIDESNRAGERALDWKGMVRDLLKLNKSIVAYGENGVSVLQPIELAYGLQTIYTIGVMNKGAVAGTDSEHYFVDKKSRLFKLSGEGLQLLDYSEYIEKLTNPILSLDSEFGLLYICDGVRGFVYSTKYPSFGEGPPNITGVGLQTGISYSIAPAAIVTPKFHIRTDIYDLGTRHHKTIQMIEVGTNLTDDLEVKIETRLSNKLPFIDSIWKKVNPSGIAYIPCYGIEFRFHLRSFLYEYMEIDYLKIQGSIHQFSGMEAIG